MMGQGRSGGYVEGSCLCGEWELVGGVGWLLWEWEVICQGRSGRFVEGRCLCWDWWVELVGLGEGGDGSGE